MEQANQIKPIQGGERIGGHSVRHEPVMAWATSALHLLDMAFGRDSVHYKTFSDKFAQFKGWANDFQVCRGVFASAKSDYEAGFLVSMQSLVSAEVLDDVLEQAQVLLNANYKAPACVVAGVALETALRRLCDKKDIPPGSVDRMNVDLLKANAYNAAMQKQILAWYARRNDAAHGNWEASTHRDVADMISGVRRFIAEHL